MLVWTLIIVGALMLTLVAIYFLAPGLAFTAAMALARRNGGLKLKHLEVDGHDVPYLEGGTGEPLLLLHGFAANKDHWTMIAPFLTRHFHVYAPDLPGFGDASRQAEASYGLDAQLKRIDGIADALGFDKFHLGGNSMGGYLAAMYATHAPARVESLWLLAPAGAMSAAASEVLTAMEAGENPLIAATMEDFDRLSELCFHVIPPMPAQFKRPLLERARNEAPFNEKIFAEIFADPIALEGRIDGLATRSLVVWGDNDRILHHSGLNIVVERLANAEAVLMRDMGHVPMLERPAETAADYLRFRGATS